MTNVDQIANRQRIEHKRPSFQGCPFISEKKSSSLASWEWIRFPALLMVTIGALGLLRAYEMTLTELLPLRFPSLLNCWLLLGGGLVLRLLAAISRKAHLKQMVDEPPRENWRLT